MRVLVVLALLCGVVYADGADKPWVGTTRKADQDAAFKKYDEANEAFAKGEYKDALKLYDDAIALWDHPGIRYNRAICLINLDRTVEAYQDLQLALKYGEDPLGKDLYNEGLNYQRLLAKQVAEIEVVSKDQGAKISVDGKPLTLTAGRTTLMLATNAPHEITASKPGYQTYRKPLEHLPAGETTRVDIRLEALEHGRWKPWAVIAGGAVLAGFGVLEYSFAKSGIDDYEKAVANTCPCANEQFLYENSMNPKVNANTLSNAHRDEVIAYSALAVGGATIVTGIVLVVRGRNKTHVVPSVGKDSGGGPSAGFSVVGSW